MRRMMRSTLLSALGWFVALPLFADEAAIPIPVTLPASESKVVSSPSSDSSVISVAANFELASEGSSPSDQARVRPEVLQPTSPVPAIEPQSISNYNFPYAPGPSNPSWMLRYLNCDPHSCPNIWNGYEMQREAELAKKCTPPSSGCRHCAGCGIASSRLFGAPCDPCAVVNSKPVNRYRAAVPTIGTGCSQCDSAPSGCATCQAPSAVNAASPAAVAPVTR